MRQRIVVIGAGGFIGRRVVLALGASSWATPVAVGHRTPLAAGRVETLSLDAADERALEPALAGADAVVNCVAGSAHTIVGTARALFAVARRQTSPPRVVHFSSMAVYGSATGRVDETAPLRGDTGAYAAAKVEAERLAEGYGAVTLRPGCVYGAGSMQWSERIARWLHAHRIGDLGAAGDGRCNLVHVSDVVTAVLSALSLPRCEAGQAFNLGSPRPPSWNEYFIRFARALGAVPVSRISQRRLLLETRLLAPPLKLAEIAARRAGFDASRLPAPIPPSLLRTFAQDLTLDVRKAERVLGLRWTAERIGVSETARGLASRDSA